MPSKLPTAKQVKRAKITSLISQFGFAVWLVTGILNITPEWMQGNTVWLLLALVTLPMMWPVIRNPEASHHLQGGIFRPIQLGLASLSLVYFFQDMGAHWFFGLMASITFLQEWMAHKKRSAESIRLPEEAAKTSEDISE